MKIVCDNCTTKYSIADEKVRGKVFKIKCKKCSHIIVVKGQEASGVDGPQAFDQKDTRVFDYGGDAPKDGAAAAAGEGVWHLVIEGEQIGPLTPADLQARWGRGEIDAETYGWREGFADWLRIGSIDELAFLTQGGAAPAAANGPQAQAGMFSAGDDATAQASSADTGDLFAAHGAGAAAAAAEEEGDLFGARRGGAPAQLDGGGAVLSSAGAATARRSDDLFGGGGMAAAGAGAVAGEAGLKGQRNENSVLFSLKNLTALASDQPKAASTGPAGGVEGSGLIDIKAMAALTLGSTKPGGGRMSEDDLPVFSPSSFAAPAAGVLLPSAPAERSNKTVFILMGVIAFLALAAIVLVIYMVAGGNKKGDDKGQPSSVASNTPDKNGNNPEKQGTDPGTTETKDPGTTETKDPGTTETKDPGTTETKDPGTTETKDPGTTATKDPPKELTPAERKEKERKDKERKEKERLAREERLKKQQEAGGTTPEPKEKVTESKSDCDALSCRIDPKQSCCKGKVKKPDDDGGGGGNDNLPADLTETDLKNGMRKASGGVMGCNDKSGTDFKVRVTVGASGSVTNVDIVGDLAPGTASCVKSAVKSRAKFRQWKGPSKSFKYPFSFK